MREGYDPHFLGTEVAAPASTHGDGVLLDGSDVLLYTTYLEGFSYFRMGSAAAMTTVAASRAGRETMTRQCSLPGHLAANPRGTEWPAHTC